MDRLYAGSWPARLAWRLGEQRRVDTLRVEIAVPRWPAGQRGLRVVFGSDFHAGPTTDLRALAHICRTMDALQPDVLLLGGDFVLFHHRYVDALCRMFADIRAPLGKFAVLGNHDLWADDQHIERALRDAGVTVLTNTSMTLHEPFSRVSIVGLDDAWVGRTDAAAAFRNATETRVVLMHAPSGLLHLADRTFDVALCGHTHGGQIALPGGIPLVTPGPLTRKYNSGVFKLQSGTLVASRGAGYAELPIRLFAPPDIVECVLGPARL